MGYARDDEDRDCVEQLQLLIDNLNICKEVELKVNVDFQELKSVMNQGIIGLQSMKNEDFSMGMINHSMFILSMPNLLFKVLSK